MQLFPQEGLTYIRPSINSQLCCYSTVVTCTIIVERSFRHSSSSEELRLRRTILVIWEPLTELVNSWSPSKYSLLVPLLKSIKTSLTGLPVISPPPGNKQGVNAPNNNVPEATNSNRIGLPTNAPFTNCAINAPIRPDAAQIPNPEDLTNVGNNSDDIVSIVFHAMIVKH